MNRREFLKIGGLGAMTFFLSGCGLAAVSGDRWPPSAGTGKARQNRPRRARYREERK